MRASSRKLGLGFPECGDLRRCDANAALRARGALEARGGCDVRKVADAQGENEAELRGAVRSKRRECGVTGAPRAARLVSRVRAGSAGDRWSPDECEPRSTDRQLEPVPYQHPYTGAANLWGENAAITRNRREADRAPWLEIGGFLDLTAPSGQMRLAPEPTAPGSRNTRTFHFAGGQLRRRSDVVGGAQLNEEGRVAMRSPIRSAAQSGPPGSDRCAREVTGVVVRRIALCGARRPIPPPLKGRAAQRAPHQGGIPCDLVQSGANCDPGLRITPRSRRET